jgi:hypothetical protein
VPAYSYATRVAFGKARIAFETHRRPCPPTVPGRAASDSISTILNGQRGISDRLKSHEEARLLAAIRFDWFARIPRRSRACEASARDDGSRVNLPFLGTLTVDGYTQKFGTLLIDIAGQFSVLNALGSADPNGYLTPVLLNGFTPEIGDSFTFIRCLEFGVSGSDEPFSRPLLHY